MSCLTWEKTKRSFCFCPPVLCEESSLPVSLGTNRPGGRQERSKPGSRSAGRSQFSCHRIPKLRKRGALRRVPHLHLAGGARGVAKEPGKSPENWGCRPAWWDLPRGRAASFLQKHFALGCLSRERRVPGPRTHTHTSRGWGPSRARVPAPSR